MHKQISAAALPTQPADFEMALKRKKAALSPSQSLEITFQSQTDWTPAIYLLPKTDHQPLQPLSDVSDTNNQDLEVFI